MKKERSLIVRGARQNNLKNITVKIPHGKFTVITGPSGSGKSSLAFDTIFAEGQRRYIESLSSYARQFLERISKPDVDSIENISPTIAIEQKNPVKTSRSTVGTATEIYDFLRLLYAKIGKPFCIQCQHPIQRDMIPATLSSLLTRYSGEKIYVSAPIPLPKKGRKGFIEMLIQEGYSRVIFNNDIHHLTKIPAEKEEILQILIDRFILNPQTKQRLADSLGTAYKMGKDRATVILPNKTKVISLSLRWECSQCHMAFPEINSQFFSFNNPYGACSTCKGFGNILELDEDLIVPDRSRSLKQGAIDPLTKPSLQSWSEKMFECAGRTKIDIDKPYKYLSDTEKSLLFNGGPGFRGIRFFFKKMERKKYKMSVRVFLSRYKTGHTCPSCHQRRLRQDALCVIIGKKNIAELSAMNLRMLSHFFERLKLSDWEQKISEEVLRQIRSRLAFLLYVGLDYLTLDRMTKTLSGGESQRIHLANQLGAALTKTTYVLDEPTIGLHPRDNQRLIKIMWDLRSLGNNIIVVEHDRDVIGKAEYLIELGPASGEQGGEVIFQGSKKDFLNHSTLTSDYLTHRKRISLPLNYRTEKTESLLIRGCQHNNLKNINVNIPLRKFVCVTGVSGSGKSSLVHDIVYGALAKLFSRQNIKVGKFRTISGLSSLKGVRLLDQKPIGKSPRSNPITYIKAYDEIRKIFSETPEAQRMGFSPRYFSFNISGGRCETCFGAGFQKLEMQFLADVYLLCEGCEGKRFQRKILDIEYHHKNINDVLNMTVDDALQHFRPFPILTQKLFILKEVGLQYLKLGQPATTLSGGEAQRLKIAKELTTPGPAPLLYILDEPTTGLHFDDVKKLLEVLQKLVEEGHSVLVIEHHLDVIAHADHVIDLGPEGGDRGGQLVAQGTPHFVAQQKKSYTGQCLKNFLHTYQA